MFKRPQRISIKSAFKTNGLKLNNWNSDPCIQFFSQFEMNFFKPSVILGCCRQTEECKLEVFHWKKVSVTLILAAWNSESYVTGFHIGQIVSLFFKVIEFPFLAQANESNDVIYFQSSSNRCYLDFDYSNCPYFQITLNFKQNNRQDNRLSYNWDISRPPTC